MSSRPLNIISVIVSIDDYRDRFAMLYGLEDGVKQHVIFTKKPSPLFPGNDKVKVVCPPTALNGVDFWNWCVQQSAAVIEESEEKWICVQYVAGTVCKHLKKKFGSQVLCGVFLASAENHYLKQKYWSIDKEGVAASPAQMFSYIKQSWKKKLIQRWSVMGCDFIIGNSTLAIDDVSSQKGVIKKVIEGNAIVGNIEEMQPANGTLQLLFVGNIQPPKGLATLFKAFQKIEEENVQLTVIGKVLPRDKKWFDSVRKKYAVQRLKLIDFVAPEKLVEYYKQSHIFVFPSFLEGSPRVIVESLKYGNLIIAKDIPGNRAIDANGDFIQFYNTADELQSLLALNIAHYNENIQKLASARLQIISPLQVDNYRKKLIHFFQQIQDGKNIN